MEAESQAGAKVKVIIVLRTDGARAQDGKDQKSIGSWGGGLILEVRHEGIQLGRDAQSSDLVAAGVYVSPQQREAEIQSDCLVITHVPDLCGLGFLM